MYVTKTQAYQRKTEKFFVSEEKKFGMIDSIMFRVKKEDE
jgi:hypothetical protein